MFYSHYKMARYELQEFFGNNLIARACEDFVTQVHYWTRKGVAHKIGFIKNDSRYVYNTVESWAEQLHISKGTLKKSLRLLKQWGLIETIKKSPHSSDQTNAYTLNYVRLIEMGFLRAPHVIRDKLSSKAKPEADLEESPPANPQNSSWAPTEPMYIDTITTKETLTACARANVTTSLSCPSSVHSLENNENSKEEEEEVLKYVSPQDYIPLQMVEIWNEELCNKPSAHCTNIDPKLKTYLRTAYRSFFQSSLDVWRMYCKQISRSPILMKSNFNLTLEWALLFKTLNTIRGGGYGVPALTALKTQEEKERESTQRALNHILNTTETPQASTARRELLKIFGPIDYLAWFTHVKISDDGKRVEAPNSFVQNYIENRFAHRFPKGMVCYSQRGIT